jgi:FkbM family methyltransferase
MMNEAITLAIQKPEHWRNAVYLGDHQALLRTIFGQKMIVDTRDVSLTPYLLLDGYWELEITNVLQDMVTTGMNVVEIGANVGYYTLLIAQKIGETGRLTAFEANPAVFRHLFRNVEINRYINRVTLVNQAVTDRRGQITFRALRHHLGSSTIIDIPQERVHHYQDEVDEITVSTTSLDEYFSGTDQRIALIKVDAEGSEPFILDGMQAVLDRNPTIKLVLEFVPALIRGAGRDPRAFLMSLEQHGFRLHQISAESSLIRTTVDELIALESCELYCER